MMRKKLLHIDEERIPKKMATVKKSTHPWLSSECEEAVRRKHAAQGTDRESDMAKECSAVFMEHHYAFINKMTAELANTKKFIELMVVKSPPAFKSNPRRRASQP